MAENRGKRRRSNRPKGQRGQGQGQGQGQKQQRGRMRSLNRPPRSEQPHSGSPSRRDRGPDGVTKRRIRDDRLFGALCHAGIFLGIWGLVTTAAVWAFRKDRSRVLRFQGAQALMYQSLAQVVFLAGTVVGVLWANDFSFPPTGAATAVTSLASISFLAGLETLPFLPLTIAHALFGFVASLLLLLCLFGLEPSYPLVGGLARRALGLSSPAPSSTTDSAETTPAEAEKKPPEEKKQEETVADKEGTT